MRLRALLVVAVLAIPLHASAQGYVVRAGDSLSSIALRYRVSLEALARANGLTNLNLIRIGQWITIPQQTRAFYYRVHWGDTLIGIAARYQLSISTIRSMNPSLGVYPLAGQWLRLCSPCQVTAGYTVGPASALSTSIYTVQPGDNLATVAVRFGVTVQALADVNRLSDPNHIVIGHQLTIPGRSVGAYDPWQARALIEQYARQYGLDPAIPLAVAWQESGFNQNMVSRTGAVGVMQIEPYTADHIAFLWGRPVNISSLDDNIHAGVYWLYQLLSYYGGNARLAVGAYYQGTRSVDRIGFYADTKQYVADVISLQSGFEG